MAKKVISKETEALTLKLGNLMSQLEDVVSFMKDCETHLTKERHITEDEINLLDTNKKLFERSDHHVFNYVRALTYKKDLGSLDINDAELDILRGALLNIVDRMDDLCRGE